MYCSTHSVLLTEPGQYITWIAGNTTSWTVLSAGVGADSTVEISQRPISQEPMVCRLGTRMLPALKRLQVRYRQRGHVTQFW